MTHDLLRNLIAHMGFEVQRIIISELRDNTYFATIELADFDKQHSTLDARPSDAIALALRCACPIVVSREVFQEQNRQEKAAETKTGEDEWPEFINEGGDFSM
jgi:bifunctional DNase/RNase